MERCWAPPIGKADMAFVLDFWAHFCNMDSCFVEYSLDRGWGITEHNVIVHKLQLGNIDWSAQLDTWIVRRLVAYSPTDVII